MRINGVCDHHDLGALGAAINLRALERQIELLQEMGCNAIRTSHNPPAPELLELCDRMGLVVMDEAFDCWLRGKKRRTITTCCSTTGTRRTCAPWSAATATTRASSCGASATRSASKASRRAGRSPSHLAAIVREEDRTRFITAGFNTI